MCKQTLSEDVKTALRLPSFDAYEWEDWEILRLMETMFIELNLIEAFHISPDTLREWLYEVYKYYNDVPFHNFRHCFCVAQMVSYFVYSSVFFTLSFFYRLSSLLIIYLIFHYNVPFIFLKARVAVPYVVCSLDFPRFFFFFRLLFCMCFFLLLKLFTKFKSSDIIRDLFFHLFHHLDVEGKKNESFESFEVLLF